MSAVFQVYAQRSASLRHWVIKQQMVNTKTPRVVSLAIMACGCVVCMFEDYAKKSSKKKNQDYNLSKHEKKRKCTTIKHITRRKEEWVRHQKTQKQTKKILCFSPQRRTIVFLV